MTLNFLKFQFHKFNQARDTAISGAEIWIHRTTMDYASRAVVHSMKQKAISERQQRPLLYILGWIERAIKRAGGTATRYSAGGVASRLGLNAAQWILGPYGVMTPPLLTCASDTG